MIQTEQLTDPFAERVARILGADNDPMVLVEQRAVTLLAEHRPIVWEGDAQTFHFSFVGGSRGSSRVSGVALDRRADVLGRRGRSS